MESGFAIDVNLRSKRSAEHRPACACGYGSNGEGLYHMAGQGGTALESSEKQWSSFFPDRLAARDCQTAGVEFEVAGKDSCDGLSPGGQPDTRIFKKKSVVGRWC